MPTFSPPIGLGVAWGDPDSTDPAERLMSFVGAVPTGETVYKTQAGAYVQIQYPYAGRPDSPGLDQASEVYLGGSIYEVTDAQALLLTVAGYGAYINKEVVDLTWWKPEDISKFTRLILTDNASSVPLLSTDNGERGQITLTSGTQPYQASDRNFWYHSDTSGNFDFDATTIMEPINYALEPEPGLFIAEQQGLALRVKQGINEPDGRNKGITLNNNIFFIVPHLNIGVWSSLPDGTSFLNRQESLAIGLTLGLPYAFDVALTGSIVRARAYKPGLAAPSWDDPNFAITVDLETVGSAQDRIDNPTPTSTGTAYAGVIGAHLGTDSRVAAKFRGTKFSPRGKLFPEI